MALSDAISIVNDALSHNPELKSYRDRVIREINTAHKEFLASGHFLFMQQVAIFTSLAPVEGSSTATVDVTSGAYAVSVTGASPSTTWEGHIFFGPDGEEYEIARMDVSNSGASTMYLMTRYAGTTTTGASDWAVRALQYPMPPDCEEMLSIFDLVNRVSLSLVSRGQDERAGFNRVSAGGPMVAVDTIQRTDRSPDFAPTLAVSAGGNLVTGHTYAVCYTLTMANRESPPSPAATITVSGGNLTIAVSALENTAEYGDRTGIFKKVYCRDVTAKGRWLCVNPDVADQLAETDATHTISDMRTSAVSYREWNELAPAEPYRQYLRFDPPTSDARRFEIRYKRRVRDLQTDSDAIQIPDPFQNIVAYRAIRRMCLAVGAERLWAQWKTEAEDLERQCRAQHLVRSNTAIQRRPIRGPAVSAFDPRYNAPYSIVG